MLLPHIITFNADLGRIPERRVRPRSKKYQRMAKVLDLPAPSVRLGVTNLLREVERLNRTLKIPASPEGVGSGALQGEGAARGDCFRCPGGCHHRHQSQTGCGGACGGSFE